MSELTIAEFDTTVDGTEPDGTKRTGGGRRLVLQKASKILPRPVRWAWDTAASAEPASREGRFPVGSLCLAVGRAGLGKSQFACWLTAEITNGILPGAYRGQPRSVIFAATEDSWAMTIVPRLIAAGADLDRVYRVSVKDDEDMHARLTLPSDNALLERAIKENDIALVVMDPLLSLIDHTINDYRAREVRQALEPLVAVADRTKATLLGLAHFTKGTGTDPLMLVSGSAAFGQLVRAAVAFARDECAEQESYVLSTIKNNLGRENLPSLAYEINPVCVPTNDGDAWVSRFSLTGEETDRSVRDLLKADSGRDAPDENDVRGWLRAYLARQGGSATPEDVTTAGRKAGYSSDQLKRAKKPKGEHPEVYSRKTGMEGGWVWSLEEGATIDADPEGSTKSAKEAVQTTPRPSPPSDSEGDTDTTAQLAFPSDNDPDRCDRCSATPSKIENSSGARHCRDCAPISVERQHDHTKYSTMDSRERRVKR